MCISTEMRTENFLTGVLNSSDDHLMVKFHTSTDDDPKMYTVITTGELDILIVLLG